MPRLQRASRWIFSQICRPSTLNKRSTRLLNLNLGAIEWLSQLLVWAKTNWPRLGPNWVRLSQSARRSSLESSPHWIPSTPWGTFWQEKSRSVGRPWCKGQAWSLLPELSRALGPQMHHELRSKGLLFWIRRSRRSPPWQRRGSFAGFHAEIPLRFSNS